MLHDSGRASRYSLRRHILRAQRKPYRAKGECTDERADHSASGSYDGLRFSDRVGTSGNCSRVSLLVARPLGFWVFGYFPLAFEVFSKNYPEDLIASARFGAIVSAKSATPKGAAETGVSAGSIATIRGRFAAASLLFYP